MGCKSTVTVLNSLLESCEINIGCLPLTTGMPVKPPLTDGIPFAYDTASKSLWFYLCDDEVWTELATNFSLCGLANNGVPTAPHVFDFCNQVEMPIRYISSDDGLCYEEVIRVSQFASELTNCLVIPTQFVVCDLPTKSQVELDAATLIEVAACVDGEDVKINIDQLKLLLA